MQYLPEGSLKVLKDLYLSKDQKGMITRKNYLIFGKLVFVEAVLPEAVPLPSHRVSLTKEGQEYCNKKWG